MRGMGRDGGGGIALSCAGPAGAATNGRIAFTSFRDGVQGQIYTMAPTARTSGGSRSIRATTRRRTGRRRRVDRVPARDERRLRGVDDGRRRRVAAAADRHAGGLELDAAVVAARRERAAVPARADRRHGHLADGARRLGPGAAVDRPGRPVVPERVAGDGPDPVRDDGHKRGPQDPGRGARRRRRADAARPPRRLRLRARVLARRPPDRLRERRGRRHGDLRDGRRRRRSRPAHPQHRARRGPGLLARRRADRLHPRRGRRRRPTSGR